MVSGAKLGWLSTLKYSTRSCSFQRSVKWKYFETCTSQTAVLGSRSTFFPTFPKVGRAQVGPKVAQLAFRAAVDRNAAGLSQLTHFAVRSEERRVGKGCRSRWQRSDAG